MEDAHIAAEISLPGNKKGMLFAVFDGHGGDQVAKFANLKFTEVLVGQADFKAGNYKSALTKAFFAFDELA